MSKKKKRKQKEPKSLVSGLMRRYRKWPRRIGVITGLVAVVAAVIIFADPFGGAPTAIDANGEEVPAGLIDGQRGARAAIGMTAPKFLLPDYDKQAVRLTDYDDKIVFLNFWATWCTFCDAEMPDIMRIARKFPDDVVVIEINRGESKGVAQGWVEDRNLPQDLPNVIWILDPREEVTREYRVEGMPQSFVINSGGLVLSEFRRVTDYTEMLQTLEPIVEAAIEARAATN